MVIITMQTKIKLPMSIKVDEKNLREDIPYPDKTFPFFVWYDIYNRFIDKTVNSHWHYDFEFGYVLSGSVDYYINNTFITLKQDDCVFVNSNMMHMSRQSKGCDNAKMFTITFRPSLLASSNSTMYNKYFQSILCNPIEGFKVPSDKDSGQEIRTLLAEIFALSASDFEYELECLTRVNRLWLMSLRYIDDNIDDLFQFSGSIQYVERAKEILHYVHENYGEKITVDDIVNHLNISRSECFRCVKRFINKSLVEYLNEYRVMKASELLAETERSISEIYTDCGFENASYFVKVFKKTYGTTPSKYRKSMSEQHLRA
jgi:AraC-like DNA-binding protein/mannose-6-phosphate isomerase-like protein (cupin superfamily)